MDKIDFYARDFNFTIKKRNKVISRFGVFLSLITISIVVASFFAFGRNFIFKKNPLILKSVVNPTKNGEAINIPHNNLIQFPFRLKLNNEKTYIPKNLEFRISSVTLNSTSGETKISNRFLNVSPCKQALIEIPAFVNFYNINDWNCIDFERTQIHDNQSFFFFGSQFSKIFQYLKIELFCIGNGPESMSNSTNKLEMNELDSKTTLNQISNNTKSICNINEIGYELEKKIFFEYLFPESYVHPNLSPDPFSLSYFPLSVELNIKSKKILQNYLSYDMVYDDIGWILEDKRPFRGFNSPIIRTDSSNVDLEGLSQGQTPLTSLEIIALEEFTLYNRIFMKMQEVAAQIGGLLNTFHVFFKIMVYFITDNMKNVLINELFDNEDKKKKITFKKLKSDNVINQGTNPSLINNNNINRSNQNMNNAAGNLNPGKQENANDDNNEFNNFNFNMVNIVKENNNSCLGNNSFIDNKDESNFKKCLSNNNKRNSLNANIHNNNAFIKQSNSNSNLKPMNSQSQLRNSGNNFISNPVVESKSNHIYQIPIGNTGSGSSNLNFFKNNNNVNNNVNNNMNTSNINPGLFGHQLALNNSMNSQHINNFVKPIKSRLTKTKKDLIYQKYQRRKSQMINIGFMDNFKRRFCYNFYDKKQPILKNYDLMCDYIDSRLDIIFYFKNLISTERFKTFFLNEHEMRTFDYMEKLNVYDLEEEMDTKKQDYYKFLDYFCDKLNQKGLKPYDEKIFNMMNDDILLEINNFNMGS